MRKRNNREKKLSITGILIIFIVVICSISVGYSVLSEQLLVYGKGNLVKVDPILSNGQIQVKYVVNSWYSNGLFFHNVEVKLINITEENIEGWTLTIPLPANIDNLSCWGAISKTDNDKIIFSNETYNAILTPNVETSFGFQFSTTDSNWSFSNININGIDVKEDFEEIDPTPSPTESPNPSPTPTETPMPTPTPTEDPITDDAVIAATVSANWEEGGYYYKELVFEITNNKDSNINSWQFDAEFLDEVSISGAWTINYIEKGNIITIYNGDWNGSIASGDTIQFNIQLKSLVQDYTPVIKNIRTT